MPKTLRNLAVAVSAVAALFAGAGATARGIAHPSQRTTTRSTATAASTVKTVGTPITMSCTSCWS